MRRSELDKLLFIVLVLFQFAYYLQAFWYVGYESVFRWLLQFIVEIRQFFILEKILQGLELRLLAFNKVRSEPFSFCWLGYNFLFPLFWWSLCIDQINSSYDNFTIVPSHVTKYAFDFSNVDIINYWSLLGHFDHFWYIFAPDHSVRNFCHMLFSWSSFINVIFKVWYSLLLLPNI